VRTVESIEITRQGQEVRITYSGSGFLYNMVRILTGTLIEVGQGKRRPGDMPVILDSLDRQNAGPTAPAKGLFLWEVRY
jgi:tRNA pseudouridine38-40 synthase